MAHIWGTISQHLEWNYFHVHDSQYESILIYIRSSWHRIINAFVTWWDKWRSSTLIFKDRWINVLSLPSLSFKITLQFIWHRNPKFNLWSLKDVSVFWEHETDGPDVLNSMPVGHVEYQLRRLVTQPYIATNTVWKACRYSRMESLLPHNTAYGLGLT